MVRRCRSSHGRTIAMLPVRPLVSARWQPARAITERTLALVPRAKHSHCSASAPMGSRTSAGLTSFAAAPFAAASATPIPQIAPAHSAAANWQDRQSQTGRFPKLQMAARLRPAKASTIAALPASFPCAALVKHGRRCWWPNELVQDSIGWLHGLPAQVPPVALELAVMPLRSSAGDLE